jgi:tubulin---tyrosine ligase
VKTSYYRPGTVYQNDGTTHPLPRGSDDADDGDGDEWVLAEATPAGCVQLGIYHYFEDRGPVDLVISGPNFGRNTTVLFGLSSGTIGAALEAALCGRKAIALSYAYSSHTHNQDVIEEALRLSVQLMQHLFDNWHEEADLYAVNVPLEPGMSKRKVQYTSMLNNRWSSGSFYKAIDPEMLSEDRGLQEQKVRQEGESVGISANGNDKSKSKIKHKSFICTPNFGDVYRSVDESGPGSDGWTVKAGMTRYASAPKDVLLFICSLLQVTFILFYSCLLIPRSNLLADFSSVTPLKANFMHAPGFEGEIKL